MIKVQEQNSVLASTERRLYPRFKKNTKVATGQLTYPLLDDDFVEGLMKNISLGGALLNLPEKLEEGSLVQLKLKLPGWQKHHPGFLKVLEDSVGTPLSAICEILRSKKVGDNYETAARFINVDPDDFIAFKQYLSTEAII